MHALNYCMLLPGPEAQQLATYIGWLLHGVRGGLVAGTLFVLPSMFVLLILSIVYVQYGNLPPVYAVFAGLKQAIIAIVIHALFKIGKRAIKSKMHLLFAAFAFILIYFIHVPFPYIIGLAALAGWAIVTAEKKRGNSMADSGLQEVIREQSINQFSGIQFRKTLTGVMIAACLWIIPFLIFLFSNNPEFWSQLIIFFSKAALVTFGGAYAVLPYVAQHSVENLNWLSELQMIDGLALGETTPGPLIMVLAFVGFMAGFNFFNGSLLMGSLALFITTFYTFLPCFVFIFAGAPIIEKTGRMVKLNAIMSFIVAAVTGVILNLTVYLSKAVIFYDQVSYQINFIALAWIAVSLLALFRLKVNLILWIGLSAAFGLIIHLSGY